jgi:CBS domain-containing protein
MAMDQLAIADGAIDSETLRARLSEIGPIASLLIWLGPINLILGAFNLVPGFPLDGGRVLRAILWWRTDDFAKATRWASGVGRAFAWALMAFGVVSLFGGVIGQGVWLLLIGWFLNNAARASYRQLEVRQALQGVPVSRVMWTEPLRVGPQLALDRFVDGFVMASNQVAFPVEQDGALVGMILLDDVRKVSRAEWPKRSVADVMTPLGKLWTLPLDAGAEQALEELARHEVDQIPIVQGSELRGLVRRRDLMKWLALQDQAA